jgi:hypothetical protein
VVRSAPEGVGGLGGPVSTAAAPAACRCCS